jgi:hypothetical protein
VDGETVTVVRAGPMKKPLQLAIIRTLGKTTNTRKILDALLRPDLVVFCVTVTILVCAQS